MEGKPDSGVVKQEALLIGGTIEVETVLFWNWEINMDLDGRQLPSPSSPPS
jgi:hypothetical protein